MSRYKVFVTNSPTGMDVTQMRNILEKGDDREGGEDPLPCRDMA